MKQGELSRERGVKSLRIFVYGTLMRGRRNHDLYCRGALQIQKAKVRGRLRQFKSDIPALELPDEDILAHGTVDPLADVEAQECFHGQLISQSHPIPTLAQKKPWCPVFGELLCFDDPASRLPDIDRLEGFHPSGQSLYRRVLVPVHRDHKTMLTAWTYVVGELLRKQLCND